MTSSASCISIVHHEGWMNSEGNKVVLWCDGLKENEWSLGSSLRHWFRLWWRCDQWSQLVEKEVRQGIFIKWFQMMHTAFGGTVRAPTAGKNIQEMHRKWSISLAWAFSWKNYWKRVKLALLDSLHVAFLRQIASVPEVHMFNIQFYSNRHDTDGGRHNHTLWARASCTHTDGVWEIKWNSKASQQQASHASQEIYHYL